MTSGMNKISVNYFFELKARELSLQVECAKLFLGNHMASLGFSGEAVLREFLSQNIPNRFKVTQGFIQSRDFKNSRQCDIIIYDCIDYSPIAKFGDIEIVPIQAVKAVIEVKTSINRNTFKDALTYFEDLGNIGVCNKFLFVFNSVKLETIKKYFIGTKIRGSVEVCADCIIKYDHGSEQLLPQGIVSLDKNYYYHLDYVSDFGAVPPEIAQAYGDDGRDMIGYKALQLIYKKNKEISKLSSLQLFMADLFSSMGIHNGDEIIDDESVIGMYEFQSFGLWDL
ncbi:MAG: hypothetical protein J6T82_00180 [Bacteroidaceae bacterium]|nr:hypothetical protein [Bacteroidaceae bacterium]